MYNYANVIIRKLYHRPPKLRSCAGIMYIKISYYPPKHLCYIYADYNSYWLESIGYIAVPILYKVMALFTAYSLLLLFTLAPLLHGLHLLCPEGSYCPTGVDCSSNSSSCIEGTCEATPQQGCLKGISVNM